MPGHLFDEIDLARHVDAPRRNGHLPARFRVAQGEAECLEDSSDVAIGNRDAEKSGDAGLRVLSNWLSQVDMTGSLSRRSPAGSDRA